MIDSSRELPTSESRLIYGAPEFTSSVGNKIPSSINSNKDDSKFVKSRVPSSRSDIRPFLNGEATANFYSNYKSKNQLVELTSPAQQSEHHRPSLFKSENKDNFLSNFSRVHSSVLASKSVPFKTPMLFNTSAY